MGYVVMQPVITPTCRGDDSQAPPTQMTPATEYRPTGRESGHESGSTANDAPSQSAGSGTESGSEYDSAPSSVGEESEASPWSPSNAEQQVPEVTQAAAIGLTGPNLESGPLSVPRYESGHPPVVVSSYQPSAVNWRAFGPPQQPQYDVKSGAEYVQESGMSSVSEFEDWTSEEESFNQNSEAGSGPESGSESGNESGSESGPSPQYIDVPRPPWDGGDAGPEPWHNQGGCRREAPLSY